MIEDIIRVRRSMDQNIKDRTLFEKNRIEDLYYSFKDEVEKYIDKLKENKKNKRIY